MGFIRDHEPQVYALMRIATGFLFLWHGLQKVVGWPVPMPMEAPAFIIWTAGPIELVGGLLVMIGLFTRPAAFLCSGLMGFAYWMAHGLSKLDQGVVGLLPSVNNGEPAALYCFVFLYICARGAGPMSVDRA
jgi:putative oxidoreductase